MNYREFGKTGEKVSTLGFGCMRFPVLDGDDSKIDFDQAIPMVRKAIDEGVTYIDTAWPYHGMMSEPFVAEALKDGYRDRVKIATKLPSWLIKKPEDMDDFLDQQLEKLQVEQIDFYLVHAINTDFWKNLVPNGLFDFLDNIKADGRVKHVGFSFHDGLDLFEEVIDAYPWDFCQIQLNYVDTEFQQGIRGLELAAERNMGVVIMEPLRGGRIVDVPTEVKELFENAPSPYSTVEWAFRWLINDERVHVVLSGMSNMEQVVDNLRIFSENDAGCMSEEEMAIIDQAADVFNSRMKVPCTACKYCLPCPVGVAIPMNFLFYNQYFKFDDQGTKNQMKNAFKGMSDEAKASACIECGQCEAACPQKIAIIDELKNVSKTLG